MRATMGVLLVLSVITACGKQDDTAEKTPMKVVDTAFGDMTQTLERAKSVEATTMQHKAEMDRAVEADGG